MVVGQVAHFVWEIDPVHGPPHTKPLPPESSSATGTFARTFAHQARSVELQRGRQPAGSPVGRRIRWMGDAAGVSVWLGRWT